jgi:Domain of unknown function (DUF4416)
MIMSRIFFMTALDQNFISNPAKISANVYNLMDLLDKSFFSLILVTVSKLEEPLPVKIFAAIIFAKNAQVYGCIKRLEKRLGRSDFISQTLPFRYTTYYEKEMGAELSRIIITFKPLMRRDKLVRIKHFTSELEVAYSIHGKRQINLDPGYIAPEHLILATGKGYYHRPYLGRGVYADLTLVYQKREFKPLKWTYPDYRTMNLRRIFKNLRDRYMLELGEEQLT